MSIKSVWEFFQVKYCLNQESRPDRWKQAIEEFEEAGIERVQRFVCIPSDQPFKSFCLSQYAMLKAFLASEKAILLTFEDDVLFRPYDHLSAVLQELPADWDILYLGANITSGVTGISERPATQYSKHLWRIRAGWTTHAVAYTRTIAKRIIADYPITSFAMYDNWLNETILPNNKCFLASPMIAWQRPGKSDLWGTETDYTGAFAEGDKIMSILAK